MRIFLNYMTSIKNISLATYYVQEYIGNKKCNHTGSAWYMSNWEADSKCKNNSPRNNPNTQHSKH